MKILIVNKFFFPNGGAEACMFDAARELKQRGHHVAYLSMSHPRNQESEDPAYFVSRVDFGAPQGLLGTLRAAARVLHSREARALMERVIGEQRPDVALLHNIYHQLSPSILGPLKRHRVPALLTLHDYKMVCPVYTLFTAGRPCDRCRNGAYYWCVAKRCSKGSLAGSLLAAAEMTLHHRVLDSYGSVDTFISPSRFLMGKLVEMGFLKPLEYLPNFIDVQALEPYPTGEDNAFVYFGRLTPEKGLRTLIAAMEGVPGSCHIIGDGPLRDKLRGLVADRGLRNVFFTPHVPFSELVARVRRATAVVLPSEWYENSPRSVLEAFALGKPVVGARSGGIPELVEDGVTGYTFAPGDAADLRRVLLSSLSDKAKVAAMGAQARRLVEQAHGPDAYCDRLEFLCRRALERR
jgi:glycosyltransferase involved in cell wall biosynthesis